MTYAKIVDDTIVEYPIYEGDLRVKYPNVSFPSPFQPPAGYVFVEDAPFPEVDYTKNVLEGAPTKQSGQWVKTWIVVNSSAEEISERLALQSNNVRSIRNNLLAKCDWTQLADVDLTASCKANFMAYRVALRAVDLLNPLWPDAPAEEWVA